MTLYNLPTGDFVTSSLSGSLTAIASSATISTGLNIAATNGLLQIDYDSLLAVGVDYGPETISYTAYNSGTGSLSGITRGMAGTTGVAHDNGASVQAGISVLTQQVPALAWDTYTPVCYKLDNATVLAKTVQIAKSYKIGRQVTVTLVLYQIANPAGLAFYITLPYAPNPVSASSNDVVVGSAAFQGTGNSNLVGFAYLDHTHTDRVYFRTVAGDTLSTAGDLCVSTTFTYESAS